MSTTAKSTTGQVVSTSPAYTFTVTADRTLTAIFEQVPIYTITATISPEGSGTVTGAGQYQEGATVTLVATPAGGYEFTGWQEGGQTVSTNATYSFTAAGDRALVSVFAVASRLPAGYTEVEYIHTNGSAGIIGTKTDFPYVFSNIRTYFKFQPDSGASDSWFFAMGNYWYSYATKKDAGNYMAVRPTSNRIRFNYYGGSTGVVIDLSTNAFSSSWEVNLSPSEGTFTLSNGSESGSQVPPTDSDPESTNVNYTNTGLFGYRRTDYNSGRYTVSYKYPCAMKLFSIKFESTSGAPIHDYVPCTNPSGVAGLYDVVSGKFWASTTSTAFTAGPAI